MKKIFIVPAIIGLIAVPNLAMAHRGTDDSGSNEARVEDSTQNVSSNQSVPSTLGVESDEVEASDDNQLEDDDDQVNSMPATGELSVEEATSIALAVYPDKSIQKVEVEEEHGVLVYSFRFIDSSRVDVRASDGVVVKAEAEEGSDEDQDSDDEAEYESDDDSGSDHTEED